MKFRFIEDHRGEFQVGLMCQELEVSRSGYYAWRGRPPSKREMANRELKEKIQAVFAESHETYGSPRIYRILRSQGLTVSVNRVARLMRSGGLRAKQARHFRSTTRRNKKDSVAPNLLQRDFHAERPNEKWLAEITYIATREGWLYLAAVLDLFNRQIVGWAMADQMTSELTKRAVQMAIREQRPGRGLIHHSDQGSQYTDRSYQDLLKEHGLLVSMNGVGTWYDNAPMESFFATLKNERVHHAVYWTRDEARVDLFYYIEGWYNRWRLHSSLGYRSPVAYAQLYHKQQTSGLIPCPQN